MNLTRYKDNLKVKGDNVYSYNTHVATIDRDRQKVYFHGYWSRTTTKHINYVAAELGFHTEKREYDYQSAY